MPARARCFPQSSTNYKVSLPIRKPAKLGGGESSSPKKIQAPFLLGLKFEGQRLSRPRPTQSPEVSLHFIRTTMMYIESASNTKIEAVYQGVITWHQSKQCMIFRRNPSKLPATLSRMKFDPWNYQKFPPPSLPQQLTPHRQNSQCSCCSLQRFSFGSCATDSSALLRSFLLTSSSRALLLADAQGGIHYLEDHPT